MCFSHMRYHKQFHGLQYVPAVAFLCGAGFLVCAVAWRDQTHGFHMLVAGFFALAVGWVLYKARGHYLEITADRVTHHGFKRWSVEKKNILRVESGKKSWVEEFDPFLKIIIPGGEYSVDNGFLIHDQRLEELVRAMQGLQGKSAVNKGKGL